MFFWKDFFKAVSMTEGCTHYFQLGVNVVLSKNDEATVDNAFFSSTFPRLKLNPSEAKQLFVRYTEV